MTDTFDVVLNRSEIAVIHTALGERLAQLLKEWEHQERAGAVDAAATLFEQADDVRGETAHAAEDIEAGGSPGPDHQRDGHGENNADRPAAGILLARTGVPDDIHGVAATLHSRVVILR